MPGPQFLLGTAPFCSPDPRQCYVTPGYEPTGRENANCWTGQKVVCTFNVAAWKKTPMFDELRREIGDKANDVVPAFQWFGSSPFCGADPCDAFKMGFLPIALDTYGDGSGCVTGDKVLGMRPILKQHYTLVDEGRKQCYINDKEKWAVINKCLDIGKMLIEQLAKAMVVTSIASPEFAQESQEVFQSVLGSQVVPRSSPIADRFRSFTAGEDDKTKKPCMGSIIFMIVLLIIIVALVFMCARKK